MRYNILNPGMRVHHKVRYQCIKDVRVRRKLAYICIGRDCRNASCSILIPTYLRARHNNAPKKALSLKLLASREHAEVSLIYAVSAFRALHRESGRETEWPFALRWLSRNEVEIHYKQTLILRGLITTLPCPLSRTEHRESAPTRRRVSTCCVLINSCHAHVFV